jgi:hypothetical protein
MGRIKGGGGDAFDEIFGNRGPYSDVTKENYYELARRSFHCFVVREGEASWPAWLAYLGGLGIPTVYARKLGSMTVPAAWPSTFDLNAPPPPPPLAPRPDPAISRRSELVGMLRDVAGRSSLDKPRPIGFMQPRSPSEAEVVRRHFEARLEELKASADKPLVDPRQRCNDEKIATGEHSRDEIAGDNF